MTNQTSKSDNKTYKLPEVYKRDLIQYIEHTTGLSENRSKAIVKKTFEWILLKLATNNKVCIKDFGIFYTSLVKNTKCKSVNNGEIININEVLRIIFKPEKLAKVLVKCNLNRSDDYDSLNNIDKNFKLLQENLEFDPTHAFLEDRNKHEVHIVRASMLTYLKEHFPYGKDWIHPITFERYSCAAIKTALLILQEINPDKYRILWALWTTRKDSIYLANKFYCSVQTIKRQWERAVDLLILFLFFPELNSDISNVTKLNN